MNFYKHHIGDYAQATAHLTFVEDAAYSRMIRKYYAEETPLPADLKAIQRLIGARSRDERDAVQAILDEFFLLADDGWHNKRCDEEIGKANVQAEANRRIAVDREEKRRARQHESSPASLHDQSTNRARETSASSGVREPSQTPDSRHQTPDKKESGGAPTAASLARSPVDAGFQPTVAGAACKAMRAAGLVSTNPGDPRLLRLLEQGTTIPEFEGIAAEAAGARKGFAWAMAALQGRRDDAAAAVRPRSTTGPRGRGSLAAVDYTAELGQS